MAGSFCISIDLELAWGVWDKPHPELHTDAERERTIVRALLALFATYEVRATWAIVGRLMELEPGRKESTAPLWYAPDLIELIRTSQLPQDIGSHSYAHPYFNETPREVLRKDLAAARRLHDANSLPFTSFVFPRNQVAHLDLLREAGVKVFRSVDQGWHMTVKEKLGRSAGRIANLADKLLPTTPAVVHPIGHGDIVELPSSMLLMGLGGVRRALRPSVVVAKARRGLEAAAKDGGCFHLWFHPSNFYSNMTGQLQTLERILAAASFLRATQALAIRPMSAFASR